MAVIETKYLGATDTRGSRIKAKSDDGSIMVPYSYQMGQQANHIRAAVRLADKYALGKHIVIVGNKLDDNGYVISATREPLEVLPPEDVENYLNS